MRASTTSGHMSISSFRAHVRMRRTGIDVEDTINELVVALHNVLVGIRTQDGARRNVAIHSPSRLLWTDSAGHVHDVRGIMDWCCAREVDGIDVDDARQVRRVEDCSRALHHQGDAFARHNGRRLCIHPAVGRRNHSSRIHARNSCDDDPRQPHDDEVRNARAPHFKPKRPKRRQQQRLMNLVESLAASWPEPYGCKMQSLPCSAASTWSWMHGASAVRRDGNVHDGCAQYGRGKRSWPPEGGMVVKIRVGTHICTMHSWPAIHNVGGEERQAGDTSDARIPSHHTPAPR